MQKKEENSKKETSLTTIFSPVVLTCKIVILKKKERKKDRSASTNNELFSTTLCITKCSCSSNNLLLPCIDKAGIGRAAREKQIRRPWEIEYQKKNHKTLCKIVCLTTISKSLLLTESCQLKVFTYLVHFLLKYFITFHVQRKERKTFLFLTKISNLT